MSELNRVLYIEDDPHIRQLVQMTLEDQGGMVVSVCQSWEEAVAQAREQTPDLFLLDVMLPEKDGVETLRALRNIPGMEGIPALFLTVDIDLSTTAGAKGLHPFEVIAKPFKVETLCNIIQSKFQAMAT